MLELVHSLSELNISQLKLVYEEGIQTCADSCYRGMHENLRILNAEQDFYADLSAFFCVDGAVFALWSVDGHYVSGIRIEPVVDGYLLTSFETLPVMRGRGLGKKLLRAVTDHLMQTGKCKIYSHVNENNLPSLNVHLFCGFKSTGMSAVFVDGSVHENHVTYVYE